MRLEINETYLITTDSWFYAPDGDQYKAVFGTVTSIETDENMLGIKTNRGSTDWYIIIGNMVVAGCQIHYCIKTKSVSFEPAIQEIEHEGQLFPTRKATTRIYNADEERGEK